MDQFAEAVNVLLSPDYSEDTLAEAHQFLEDVSPVKSTQFGSNLRAHCKLSFSGENVRGWVVDLCRRILLRVSLTYLNSVNRQL